MGFFFSILEAKETIDIDKKVSFKRYVKSNLFLTPTFMLALSGIYIIALIMLLTFRPPEITEIQIVTIWAMILLLVTIAFMITGQVLVKRRYDISLPYYLMIKYSLVTTLSSITVFYLSETTLTYTESVYDFIPQVIPIVLIGTGIYFGITYLIDESTKNLFKSIVKEIKKK